MSEAEETLNESRPGILEAICTNGYVGEQSHCVASEADGVVPLVFRTRIPYVVPDVQDGDPYYVTFTEETRSEQAVALVFNLGRSERCLGVLNQESHIPGAFDAASAQALKEDATQLILHLLALEAHEGRWRNRVPCLWNPNRHGWDFRRFLNIVVHRLKASLGRYGHGLNISIWYADPDDKMLYTLVSTGYGSAFLTYPLTSSSVPVEKSFTWQMAVSPEGTVADCAAGDPRLLRPEVDRAMGLLKVRAVTVRTCRMGEDDLSQSGMVLSLYVTDEKTESVLPDEADLREMARLILEQIDAYVALCPELAAAEIAHLMKSAHDSTDLLPKLAERIGYILQADAVTLLARPRGSDRLYVAAATAPLDFHPSPNPVPILPHSEHNLIDSGYLLADASGTAWIAAHPGHAIRVNSPRSHAKLPEGFPRHPSLKLREWLPKTKSEFRRFLGVGIQSQDTDEPAQGVVRVIRSSNSRPFTRCDRAILQRIESACRPAFQGWRDMYVYHSSASGDRASPLSCPMPRSTTQATRDQIQEILVSVYDLVNAHFLGSVSLDGDFILQVALLIEQPANEPNHAHVFAYYSRLAAAPPPAGSKFAFDTPRLGSVTWMDLIDSRCSQTLTPVSEEEDVVGEILSVARTPFISWSGRHSVRGALAVDLSRPKVFDRTLLLLLTVAARKIATVLARAGCDHPIDSLGPQSGPDELVRALRQRLRAEGVRLQLAGPTRRDFPGEVSDGTLPPLAPDNDQEEWLLPITISPRDGSFGHDVSAETLGVREAYTSGSYALRVPLVLDGQRVGDLVAAWELDTILDDPMDCATRRSQRIGEILACWMSWTWNRVEIEVEPVNHVQPGAITTWKCTPRLRMMGRERSGAGGVRDDVPAKSAPSGPMSANHVNCR